MPEKIRIFSLISDQVAPTEDALEVGMQMEMIVETARLGPSGQQLVTYKFRPAGGGSA
jgi:hypothetical protein